jgi:hypothetical protein
MRSRLGMSPSLSFLPLISPPISPIPSLSFLERRESVCEREGKRVRYKVSDMLIH